MESPPPIPEASECAVINNLAAMPSCRERIFDTLAEDDFGYRPARDAYMFLKRAWDNSVSLDGERIYREFMEKYGDVRSQAEPTHYAAAMGEVLDSSTRRKAWTKTLELQDSLRRSDESLRSLTEASADITELLQRQSSSNDGGREIEEIVASELDMVERASQGESVVMPFGFKGLEEWQLLRPGTLNLVAGRPGAGKTALMCTCLNAQGDLGLRPACYCAEMTDEEILIRMVSQRCGIPFEKIISGLRGCTEAELHRYKECHEQIIKFRPRLRCGLRMTINDYEAFAIDAVKEHGAKVLWLDYVQKLVPAKRMEMRLHILECSGRLKALAQRLQVPIVVLAQLNREAEDGMPKISHLKEAGALEEDADGVILMDRPYARPSPAPRKYAAFRTDVLPARWEVVTMEELEDKMVLIVSKNRNGPTGLCYAHFNGPMMSMGKARWSWST